MFNDSEFDYKETNLPDFSNFKFQNIFKIQKFQNILLKHYEK